MVNTYKLNEKKIELSSDVAAEEPIYIYHNTVHNLCFYSKSITQLLNYVTTRFSLEIDPLSLSFLLQSGVVPAPNTIYKDIFILSIGDKAVIETYAGKIKLTFSKKFPFLYTERGDKENITEDEVLSLIDNAIRKKINADKETFLFHSAGKDSNTIALALANSTNRLDNITLLSHQSSSGTDESEISFQIAKKLGFKHQKLFEPSKITTQALEKLYKYFENIPLPSLDNVALAYPFYMDQIDFTNSNIIDGMGNDVYIGHIPSQLEFDLQKKYSKFKYLRKLFNNTESTSKFLKATSTRSEWTGLIKMSYHDSKKIYPLTNDVFSFWLNQDKLYKSYDYFDFRAAIRGVYMDQEVFLRKVRNLADITHANLILPWCDSEVVNYFFSISENRLVDRKNFKNKLFLREMLKNRLDLDSDKLGKMGFSFDFYAILSKMERVLKEEILTCPLWDKVEIEKFLYTQLNMINANDKSTEGRKALINRLFIISAWYNHNKYLKCNKHG